MSEWKDIPGYEGLYQINKDGQVKRLIHTFHHVCKDGSEYDQTLPEKYLKVNRRGCVGLFTRGVVKDKRIDDLLAITFLGLHRGEYVHKDNDLKNMTLNNLVSYHDLSCLSSSEDEVWKPIIIDNEDYSEYYECSTKGRIRSKYRVINQRGRSITLPSKMLKLTPHSNQSNHYLIVTLCKDSKPKQYLVHRIVAKLFVKNTDPLTKQMVNHIDSNKSNNCCNNLEWVSNQENVDYAWSHGEISSETLKQNVLAMIQGRSKKWQKILCNELNLLCSSREEGYRKTGVSPYLIKKSCETGCIVKGLSFSYI